MGCGASNDPKIGVSDSINPVKTNNNNSRNNNGFKQVELKNSGQNSYSDPRNLPDTRNKPPPPTAFVISFDENNGDMKRPPPGRLRLEPLKHQPKITKEDLEDKMRNVELNRERILAERAKSSGSKKNRTPNSTYNSDRYDSETNNRNENNYNKRDSKPNGGYKKDDYEYERERNNEDKQRMLKNRRIVQQPDDSDDIEHDRNYNRRDDDDYFNDRRYKK